MATYELIPKLVRAAYADDKKAIENLSIMLGRSLKKEYPGIATEIMDIAANHKVGGNVYRSVNIDTVPIDAESRKNLVKIEENYEELPPILEKTVIDQIEDFIKERALIEKFLEQGIIPSNSLLLYGKPGVGKTYTAKWIANQLHMPMITVDLATTMSSYLGKSGQNIKSIFEYTKKENVILFLDEIDAIAKKRDDEGDLGELKRLVNVLLKELEDCPSSCVIIGATNHPEMLDKAIWRRFDRSIEVTIPDAKSRADIISRSLSKWKDDISKGVIDFIITQMEGKSPADICRLSEHIKRQIIMNEDQDINILAIREVCRIKGIETKEEKIELCKEIKNANPKLSVRDISDITLISSASVARYLRG